MKRKRITRTNNKPLISSHGFVVTTVHNLYSKKPSEVAKTTAREEIPQSLWDMWSFSQQQIYLNKRKSILFSNKITEEIEAAFRCNKKLQQYA